MNTNVPMCLAPSSCQLKWFILQLGHHLFIVGQGMPEVSKGDKRLYTYGVKDILLPLFFWWMRGMVDIKPV